MCNRFIECKPVNVQWHRHMFWALILTIYILLQHDILYTWLKFQCVITFATSNPTIFFVALTSAAGRRVFDHNIHDSTSNSTSSSNSSVQRSSAQMPVSFAMACGSGNAVSSVLNLSEYRGVIERNNRQNKSEIDDDSTDSASSFRNYSKRLNVGGNVGSNVENIQERFRCVLLNGNWLIRWNRK